MSEQRKTELELSAWLDGELDGEKAREIEALLARSPELSEEVRLMRASGALLRQEVDAAERGLDMSDFSSRVMASIDSAPSQEMSKKGEAVSSGGLLGKIRRGLADLLAVHRPAVAAAATMLLVLGGSSFYFLFSNQPEIDPASPLLVRGGSTVIEDLSFGDASAVVYRTEADVTVIWVTED